MTVAWLIGPPLAMVYAILMLRFGGVVLRMWDRRHPHGDTR